MPQQVNLLGFGTMGRQIAACLDWLGYRVSAWVRDGSAERLRRYAHDRRLFEKKAGAAGRPGGEVRLVTQLSELRPALTIEALAEDLGLKRRAVAGLGYTAREADLFTNSSSYRPDEIAAGMQALHFFNPLHTLRFVETTCETDGLSPAGAALFDDLRSIGFSLIRTGANRGHIGNYILFREIAAALKLADEHGHCTGTIDEVLSKMGRTTSLFDIIDLVGVDITRRILMNLNEEDPSVYVSPRLEAAIAGGVLGRKNRTSIRQVLDGTAAPPTRP